MDKEVTHSRKSGNRKSSHFFLTFYFSLVRKSSTSKGFNLTIVDPKEFLDQKQARFEQIHQKCFDASEENFNMECVG